MKREQREKEIENRERERTTLPCCTLYIMYMYKNIYRKNYTSLRATVLPSIVDSDVHVGSYSTQYTVRKQHHVVLTFYM